MQYRNKMSAARVIPFFNEGKTALFIVFCFWETPVVKK